MFKFTTREIEQAMKKLIVVVDSREQKAEGYKSEWKRDNVRSYSKEDFDYYNLVKKTPKKDLIEPVLPAGDYSAMLPPNTFKGIERALWFDKVTVVEKKANINEIAGNISKTDRIRMRNEFARLKANGTRHRIFIQDTLYFKHIYEGSSDQKHNWATQNSLKGAIDRELSVWETELIPVPAEYMAREIYSKLKNDVRTYLEEHFCIENMDKL